MHPAHSSLGQKNNCFLLKVLWFCFSHRNSLFHLELISVYTEKGIQFQFFNMENHLLWHCLLKKNPPFTVLLFFFFIGCLFWVFVAAWAFSSCSERGLLFVVVRGLLIVVASLVAEPRL